MSKDIILSREGIFPTAQGATGLGTSGTVQGEGKLVGMPSMFVRLQGCNLRCIWTGRDGKVCMCDTAHTSFGGGEPKTISVGEAIATLRDNMGGMSHVVVTGGEPLLQKEPLGELLRRCREEGWHTTLETNGTIYDEEVSRWTSLMSISPKLKSSIPTEEKLAAVNEKETVATKRHKELIFDKEPITKLIASAKEYNNDVQVKFVVSQESDEKEIKEEFADVLSMLKPDDIVIMPMGKRHSEIEESNKAALQMAIKNGWRYTPRLHIDLFGDKEGV